MTLGLIGFKLNSHTTQHQNWAKFWCNCVKYFFVRIYIVIGFNHKILAKFMPKIGQSYSLDEITQDPTQFGYLDKSSQLLVQLHGMVLFQSFILVNAMKLPLALLITSLLFPDMLICIEQEAALLTHYYLHKTLKI